MSTPVTITVDFVPRQTHAGHFVVVRTLEGQELHRTPYSTTAEQARAAATRWLEAYRTREYAASAAIL